MTTEVIAARGITKTFKDPTGAHVHAVAGVDVSINAGEVVALLGPNGAGKTTFLDIALGLVPATAGTMELFGTQPRKAISAAKVSAVLQTGGLLWDVRVRELIAVVASMYPRHLPVSEAMVRAGITELANRKISKCSGGEQQRIRFALALLPDPELLILDEPTAGMDVSARRQFWDAMHAEAEAGRTVVFATHYLEEAEQYSQRIVLMNNGLIAADGPTDEIRASTAARHLTFRTENTGDAVPHLEQVLATLEGTRHTRTGAHFSVHSTDSDAAALALLQAGAKDLQILAPSLEEAFIALTAKDSRS